VRGELTRINLVLYSVVGNEENEGINLWFYLFTPTKMIWRVRGKLIAVSSYLRKMFKEQHS
jgi:hypothetical protein